MRRSVQPLITEEAIAARLPALAAEVVAALPASARREGVLMVGPLKGAVVFMADLARALGRQGLALGFDFLRLSSYGRGTVSTGTVVLERDLLEDPAGRHLLLVDDIVDTGRTLDFAQRHLSARGPASVTTVVFMDKPARREVAVRVDHVGFVVPDSFVVGYGCDYAEQYRELPYIGVLER